MERNNKRHILKTITWRLVATLTTIIISYILTKSITIGLGIGLVEFIVKGFLYYFHERIWYTKIRFKNVNNLTKHNFTLTKKDREIKNHKSKVLWLTGYSGSGKSAIANEVEKQLHLIGYRTFILDGDNVRLRLNSDLSFSNDDRDENIRRVSEVAKLFVESGTIVITSFISPLKSHRELAKHIIGERYFNEIHVDTTLTKCVERDCKGLYKKAFNGKLKNMTGIDAPYESPLIPDLVVDGNIDGDENIKKSAKLIIDYLILK